MLIRRDCPNFGSLFFNCFFFLNFVSLSLILFATWYVFLFVCLFVCMFAFCLFFVCFFLGHKRAQLVNDVIGDEMEDTYDEAAIFWQGLKRELALAVSEKMAFLKQQGVQEDDLDLSSEEEGLESESDVVEDSDTESVTARRRYDTQHIASLSLVEYRRCGMPFVCIGRTLTLRDAPRFHWSNSDGSGFPSFFCWSNTG